MAISAWKSILVALSISSSVYAQTLVTSSTDSIKSYAGALARHMVSQYSGNETGQIPGLLDSPYYWWEAGALFGTLIEYWHLTGDTEYNDITTQGILFQTGPDDNFMPPNQTKTMGNDDQAFWALAAMSAAEYGLPEASEGEASWELLAKNVFNAQAERWDTATCGGGLRWQILPFNAGYNYKNSISTGTFFQLATRLARYTGNSTYSDWAEKTYDWIEGTPLLEDWNVYDGAETDTNCTNPSHIQFSYVAGTWLTGAAHMYNITNGGDKWKTVVDGLLEKTISVFFPDGILSEVSCEGPETCNTDMMVMKGFLAQWMATTLKMAPYTASTILPVLTSSAEAAAKVCGDGSKCTNVWSSGVEGSTNKEIGQQMSALSVVQALLIDDATVPSTGSESTGNGSSNGTSAGSSPSASQTTSETPGATSQAPSSASKVVCGASGFMMPLILAGTIGFAVSCHPFF